MDYKKTFNEGSPSPKTPDEIAAAKIYLREAFAHAVEKVEALVQTPEEIRMREYRNRILKSRGMSDDDIAARDHEAMQGLREAAREVLTGSQRGDEVLDRVIKSWQSLGDLPSFLKSESKKDSPKL